MADYDEETGGSKQERKEEQEFFDRDLNKVPVVQAMMGEDFYQFFNK